MAISKDKLDLAYEMGWNDGNEMARESGSADAGCDGWDGMLLNAVGYEGVCRLFVEPVVEDRNSMSDRVWELLSVYAQGAQDGAEEATKE